MQSTQACDLIKTHSQIHHVDNLSQQSSILKGSFSKWLSAPGAAIEGCSAKKVFLNIHRKTPVPESLS